MPTEHRSRWAIPVPLAIVGSLTYIGVISLGLLVLRAQISTREPVRLALYLTHDEGVASLRWASCAASVVLVVFLWVHWRSGGGGLRTVFYLGAAALVFLTHFAVLHLLGVVPSFVLVPL